MAVKSLLDLTPNKLNLSFPAPNACAKFHQIRFKIATAERRQ